MRVLVTGTEGYIGAVVPPALIERGHEVVGVDSGFHRAGLLYRNGVPSSPETMLKDIRRLTEDDLRGVRRDRPHGRALERPRRAAQPADHVRHQPRRIRAPRASSRRQSGSSASSTRRRAACTASPSRTSSTRSPRRTRRRRTRSARRSSSAMLGAMADDAFSPTFLRNATAYGASPRMRFDIVLNNLSGLAWTTREIRMESDGTPWRPFVHIRDIAKAIACALEAPREAVHNEIFNVGSSTANYQVREIAEIVGAEFPDCAVTLAEGGGPDTRSYRVSFDKINGASCLRSRASGTPGAGRSELHDVFDRIEMTHGRLHVARLHAPQADRVPAAHGADRRRVLLDELNVLFRDDDDRRRLRRRARADRGRERVLRTCLLRRRIRGEGHRVRGRRRRTSPDNARGDGARPALPGPSSRRRRSCSAASGARRSTSPSTCGRDRGPTESGSASGCPPTTAWPSYCLRCARRATRR